MSHKVEIKTEIRDPAAIRAACVRLGLPAPVHGTATLFDGAKPTGWQVMLPGWSYPAVCMADGTIAYDTYHGRWGDEKHLAAFRQTYAVCHATALARTRYGTRAIVRENVLPDGSIRLAISVP